MSAEQWIVWTCSLLSIAFSCATFYYSLRMRRATRSLDESTERMKDATERMKADTARMEAETARMNRALTSARRA